MFLPPIGSMWEVLPHKIYLLEKELNASRDKYCQRGDLIVVIGAPKDVFGRFAILTNEGAIGYVKAMMFDLAYFRQVI